MQDKNKQEYDCKAAGKTFQSSGSVRKCLQPGISSPTASFNQNFEYPKKRLSYIPEISHGVSTQSSLEASLLINPEPLTYFKQRVKDKDEYYYQSKISPLGKCRLPTAYKGEFVPDNTQLYGEPIAVGDPAGEIINPPKSYKEVEEEAKEGHEQYVKTHHDYDVGETIDRKYDWGNKNPKTTKFGIETPHYCDGAGMAQSLRWMHKKPLDRKTFLVSKREDNFRQRTQPQLGKVHDPIADTLNVPPDFTFGIVVKPEEFGVGDLLHMRSQDDYLSGKDRERGIMSTVRQHLKKANYHNFNNLESAFSYYDHDKTGYIDAEKLRDACWKFNLPIDNHLLKSLMHYCAVENNEKIDETFKIDYVKFVNFLNWKDKKRPPIIRPNGVTLAEMEEKVSADAIDVERLKKQIDKAVTNHVTSSSIINAVVGGMKHNEPANGIPTIRWDLPAPRIRRISDQTNYGDQTDAYGLINPSLYSTLGVHEEDFFLLRPRSEIKEIFENIGVNITEEAFDEIWKVAVKESRVSSENKDESKASVEAFRAVLDRIQAQVIEET